jgi:hypothetical protein
MKRILRTLFKLIASGDALVANAIQLSEVSDETGAPLPGREAEWNRRAQLVAFEALQERRHLGVV